MKPLADKSVPRGSLLLAVGAGLVAFAVAAAIFWSFEDPWTLRGDNKAVLFPMNLDAWRIWLTGHPPEWTDKIWAGFPLLSDPTSMALYWPNAIGFLLTPEPHLRAYDVATAFHAGILVAGVVFLLRLLEVRVSAALLGGVLIFMAPMHVWYASSMITGYAPVTWWPWMLVAAELLARRGFAFGPLVLGWVALASCALVYPEFALYGGAAAAAWLLTTRYRPFHQRLLLCLVLGVGGIALAAPQLVPTVLFLPETTRGTDLEELRRFDITQIYFSADSFLYPSLAEVVPSFLGVATLLVAVVGAFSRRPRAVFAGCLAAVSFALALGFDTPLYSGLRAMPVFGLFRQAMKFKLMTELAVAVLFGMGVDRLSRRSSIAPRRPFAMVLIALALLENFTYLAQRVPTGVSLPGAADESFARLYEQMNNSTVIRYALAGPQPPVARISDRLRFRAIPTIAGVPSLGGGPNALLPERHRRIFDAFNSYPGPTADEMDYLAVQYDVGIDPGETSYNRNPCLSLASARGLLMVGRHDGTCVFYDPNRPSRFVIAPGVRAAADVESMIDQLDQQLRNLRLTFTVPEPEILCETDPPLSTDVLVETVEIEIGDKVPVVAPEAEIRKRARTFGRAGVVDYRPGEVDLLTVANRPGFLIFKESYFSGWEVTVDAEAVPTYPAAGLFFAVPVPPGQHQVYLRYRTPGLETGVRIALGWVVAACVLEILRRLWQARRAGAA